MTGDTTADASIERWSQSSPRITTTGEFEQRGFELRNSPPIIVLSSICRASVSDACVSQKRPTNLIDHPLFDAAVGVDPAISQEWPVRSMLVNTRPIDFRRHNLFLID